MHAFSPTMTGWRLDAPTWATEPIAGRPDAVALLANLGTRVRT